MGEADTKPKIKICFTLLDVESVPPGYPTIFNFLPDIDTFYENWLERKAPDK